MRHAVAFRRAFRTAKLSKDDRILLNLLVGQGLTVKEAAARMGIGHGVARTRKSRTDAEFSADVIEDAKTTYSEHVESVPIPASPAEDHAPDRPTQTVGENTELRLDVPSIRVLGKLAVAAGDGANIKLSPRPRRLLAAFVAAGPEGASIDSLAETLWGSKLPDRWQATFRMAVSRLRSALDAELVSDGGGRYRLDLPLEAVDAWWLLELAADEDRPVTGDDLRRAIAGVAFGDIDAAFLVADASSRCANAQSTVAVRFCTVADDVADADAALLIEHQQAVAPYQEDLILAIAGCLHRSQKAVSAASYLDDVLAIHQADLGTQEAALLAFRDSLDATPSARSEDGDLTSSDPRVAGASGRRIGQPPEVPSLLEHVVGEPLFGRDDEVAQLLGGRSQVVIGPLGSGKTRLLAAAAEAAVAHGDRVSYVGADSSRTPYGPFLAAFPKLRSEEFVGLDRVDPVADGGDSAAVRTADTKRTLLVVDHLDSLADSGRHWLLIDDVHMFDEASRRLIGFLAVAETKLPLSILVAGRNDEGHDWFTSLLAELRRAGFGSVSVGPLGPTEMEAMLRESLPELSATLQDELARALFDRSGGLPAVARMLISSIDSATLTFDDGETYEPGNWVQPTLDLERSVFQVGVAAAVLGDIFAINDVMALLERPEDDVGAALEVLWDREIVVDGKDPSELRFANTLLRKVFLRGTPSFRLAELNAMAAALAGDIRTRADHEAAAVPIVHASQAAQSLLESARASMADGAWLDAVNALRRSEALLDGDPDIRSLILMARALDLSGSNGTGPRKVAFRRAAAEQRWGLALAAALSGLPEAEWPDGDSDRIAMLESIPVEHLDEHERFEHALVLARQCALNGWPDQARSWANEVRDLATTSRRQVRSEIISWSRGHHVVPDVHRFTDELVDQASGPDRMRILQRQAISSLEIGELETAAGLHHRFAEQAEAVGDPAGIWQCKVLHAAIAFAGGRWTEASMLSRDAEDYGKRHAMQQAALVRLGQDFCHKLVTGEQGDLVAQFARMPVNTNASAIATAARALSLAARGSRHEAWHSVRPTVVDALDRPRSSALVVLAMLAGLTREAGEPEVVDRVRERLALFADRSLVVGYGVATTGPVQQHLASLSHDRDEAIARIGEAVRVADRSGAMTWQVVTRLSLARMTNDDAPVDEAAELAAGTELVALLPSAAGR
ncbi:MAG: AAA family ATPase [Acidimicrobiales bacterium]